MQDSDHAVQHHRTSEPESPHAHLPQRLQGHTSTVPDNASTASDATLVPGPPLKPASKEELETHENLMAKAKTMTEAEFKDYLQKHNTGAKAAGRRNASEGLDQEG